MASLWFEDGIKVGDILHGGHQTNDNPDLTPISLVEYIEPSCDNLHGEQFSAMHLAGDVCEILHVRTERMHDTPFGAWIRQWGGWSRRRATNSLCHFSQTYSLFIPRLGILGTRDAYKTLF